MAQQLIEGRDFYLDNGLMVLTAYFLENRGYCCGNKCRHCPYEGQEKKSTTPKEIHQCKPQKPSS